MSDVPLPRKKLSLERKDTRPQHDTPCKRISYSDAKSLFEMLLSEALHG